MNRIEVPSCGILRLLLPVVLLAAMWPLSLTAQDAQPADKPAQSAQNQSAQEPTKPAPASDEPQDVKITPRQAEELFHSVDEILQFDSKETGLPIKHDVKRKLTSRDEVVSYLTKHVNDEDTQRLRRSELVLKKFGLLPRDFNLETFLVALLREQVAGYYDPKTQHREPARLGAHGRAGAGDGPRTHARPARPGRQPAEMDEAGRKGSWPRSRKTPLPPTSKTTKSTTPARPSSRARPRP